MDTSALTTEPLLTPFSNNSNEIKTLTMHFLFKALSIANVSKTVKHLPSRVVLVKMPFVFDLVHHALQN